MAFLVFILISLSILYFGHYWLYSSFVHFFGIAGRGSKLVLALILFLLPTSFIAAEVLARRATPFQAAVLG